MDISEAINRGYGEILYAGDDGLLVKNVKGENLLLSSTNSESAKKLCLMAKEIPHDCLVVRGEGAAEAVSEVLHYGFSRPCYQCAYLKKERLNVLCEGDIRPLEYRFIPEVMEHYKMARDPEHVKERIDSGEMFGVFAKGTDELWGFIGLHDDGSGGMLEIFPEYRRRGLGMAMEAHILNLQLDKGYIPYGQIFCDNEKSLSLQRRLGLELSEETLVWTFDEQED